MGGGDPETAGGAANLKSEVINEISDPKNPRIDTNDTIYDVMFEYRSDGSRRRSAVVLQAAVVTYVHGMLLKS